MRLLGNKKLKQVIHFSPNLIAVKETIEILKQFYLTFLSDMVIFKNSLVERIKCKTALCPVYVLNLVDKRTSALYECQNERDKREEESRQERLGSTRLSTADGSFSE